MEIEKCINCGCLIESNKMKDFLKTNTSENVWIRICEICYEEELAEEIKE